MGRTLSNLADRQLISAISRDSKIQIMDEEYKVSGAVIFSLIMISLVLMCIISACIAKLQRTRSKKYAPEHSYGTYPKGEKPYLKDLQFINEKYAKKAWYPQVFLIEP